jgi:hypothetical protein
VWELVCGLLTNPEQLRADLERMVELERDRLHGAPHHETKVWLEKLIEVDQERRGYHRLAAEGLMSDEELYEALATCRVARDPRDRRAGACCATGPSGARRSAGTRLGSLP